MLILDTDLENRSEYPTASQLLQGWATRLRAWLRRKPQTRHDEIAREQVTGEESMETQDCGRGLIL